MLTILDQDLYENEVMQADRPVLLCFFSCAFFSREINRMLKALSREYALIGFYAVPEEEHRFFFEKFQFIGTPTFILLERGMERGRILGMVSFDELNDFIQSKIRESRKSNLPFTEKSPAAGWSQCA
ncbi:MAG: thioredoxin family protein [Thermodesulfobacteriota bacterium]